MQIRNLEVRKAQKGHIQRLSGVGGPHPLSTPNRTQVAHVGLIRFNSFAEYQYLDTYNTRRLQLT